MKKRTTYIITALLAAVIIVSGVYIVKTLFLSAPETNTVTIKVTQAPSTPAPSGAAAPATGESQSAQSAQADDSNPIQPREVDGRSAQNTASNTQTVGKKTVVLDPGHGVSTSTLSAEERRSEGYVQNGSGSWGEWRHWTSGGTNTGCEGCSLPCPSGATCWYSMSNGDRSTEPEINLNNCLSAKKHLEDMGYTVRITRNASEHPAFSSRISLCYQSSRTALPPSGQEPDADIYVCIHSNAGGGKGSAYIKAGGTYMQKFKSGLTAATYAESCNALGSAINSRITQQTSLSAASPIGGEEALMAFCKSPIPVGYLEIGYFDNSSDLSILRSESDRIGLSIAEGIDDYFKTH